MKLPCDVVKDVLPMYADGMVSECTRSSVEEHLAVCDACRNAFEKLENQENKHLPSVKDSDKRIYSGNRRRFLRRWLTVITALLVLLTLVAGWMVYAWVPVWIPYEDAVLSHEQVNSFVFRVYTQPEVYGAYGLSDRVDGTTAETVSFYGYRSSLFYDTPVLQDGYAGFHADHEVWFRGAPTGEDDRLLHGEGVADVDSVVNTNRDRRYDALCNYTLYYVCWGALCLGILLLGIGLLLRRKQVGQLLMQIAIPFLCCCAACLFVTDGYLLCDREWGSVIGFGYLRRYLSVGGMTLLLWGCTWSIWAQCKQKRLERRR